MVVDDLTFYDIIAVSASLAVLTVYHIHLYYLNPQCFGGRLPYGVNLNNARTWIRKHKEMSESPAVLLAVQTVRNTMMAAVFVGGNAITLAYSMSNNYDNLKSERMKLRSIIITALMFASFLAWANVTRLCSLLGYMIGTMQYCEQLRKAALEQEREEFVMQEAANGVENATTRSRSLSGSSNGPPAVQSASSRRLAQFRSRFEDPFTVRHGNDKIAKHTFVSTQIPDVFTESEQMLQMMTVFFSVGFRLLFASIPFAFYSVGPLALVITTGCVMLFLATYDHMRQGHESAYIGAKDEELPDLSRGLQ